MPITLKVTVLSGTSRQNTGIVATLSGLDRKEVDKAFAQLKKDGAIVSPVRCKQFVIRRQPSILPGCG